jgi:hypothetical protein
MIVDLEIKKRIVWCSTVLWKVTGHCEGIGPPLKWKNRCPKHSPWKREHGVCNLLVTVSNGGCSPSSGFLNCPQPQLPVSHSNNSQQLNLSGYLTNSVTHQPTPIH